MQTMAYETVSAVSAVSVVSAAGAMAGEMAVTGAVGAAGAVGARGAALAGLDAAAPAGCASFIEQLERIREATLELRLMQEEYHALRPTPQSPRLDGMPRAGGTTAAGESMARLVDARSMLAGRIRQSGEALSAMLERARPRLDALPAHLFAFCLHYYVNAEPIADVARTMQRDKKTLYEYKKKLAASE